LQKPYPGVFNFSDDLDVVRFIEMAGELGLHVLFRPGPYICAEWEWGGHPYWLLHDTDMKVRTTYPGYLDAVEKFYRELFGRVNHLMYRNGGPIIAVQIENEYAGFAEATEMGPLDPGFLTWLRQTIKDQQCEELLFTSDGGWDFYKYELEGDPYGLNFDDVLRTVNFQTRADFWLNILGNNQPDKPKMVMEWWSGWFDFWGYHHQGTTAESFEENLRAILSQNASVNYYMFHGGTNFGFMNGANFNTNSQTGGLEYQPGTKKSFELFLQKRREVSFFKKTFQL
jgi:beta-galactosidase